MSYLDEIIVDPIHDILHRLKFWLNRGEEKYDELSDEQLRYYRFLSELNKFIAESGEEFADEIIKYSILKGDTPMYYTRPGETITYYSKIINSFFLDLIPSKHEEYRTRFIERDELIEIDYEKIINVFSKSKELQEYYFMLNKWNSKNTSFFDSYSLNDIMESQDTIEYLVSDFIVKNSTNMIYAKPGIGKTFLSMYMQLCLAGGLPFFNRVTQKTKTAYFDLENGTAVMSARYRGLFNGLNVDDEEKKEILQNTNYNDKKNNWDLVYYENNELKINYGNLNKILAFCNTENIGCLIIDPIIDLGDFKETNEDFAKIKREIFFKLNSKDITIVLLHHSTKGTEKDGAASSRGGSSLEGAVSTSFQIIPDKSHTDIEGRPTRFKVQRVKGRSGERGFVYDIEFNESINENSKDYESIILSQVKYNNGLSPEEREVLTKLSEIEYWSTQDMLSLFYENGLIEDKHIKSDNTIDSRVLTAYTIPSIQKIMKHLQKHTSGEHEFVKENGKKIKGNVYTCNFKPQEEFEEEVEYEDQ